METMVEKLRYPQYDLDSAVDAARALQAKGGMASAPELATFLGYKGHNNGAYLSRVAAARMFGLMEGQGKGSPIKVTDLALRILHPESVDDGVQDRISAFLEPPLFKALFERFQNKPLPEPEGLGNVLRTQFAIPEASVKAVTQRFLDSAAQAGLRSVDPAKLIRPTAGSAALPSPKSSPASTSPVHSTPSGAGASGSARGNKIIDGALDLLPPVTMTPGWTDAELKQWLQFFEGALRVLYRIPATSDSSDHNRFGAALDDGGAS